jgi:hypothetical protein
MDCLGCHASSSAADNIDSTGLGAPQVVHNYATDLAAGNFRYVFFGDDAKGHNVHGFGLGGGINFPDIRFLVGSEKVIPPGYLRGYDPSTDGYDVNAVATEKGLMCAGANGCHGNRDYESTAEAMKGTHHADDKILKFGVDFTETGQGATPGASYRFLRGVHGGEDADWQATKSPTDHNEYKGETYSSRTGQSWAAVTTTSRFCAECHGDFHKSGTQGIGGGVSGVSPWLRHPTDVQMPNSGEFADYITYNVDAPVARTDLAAVAGGAQQTVGTNAAVMCLSCHKAHASAFDSLLRWDYSGTLGSGIACKVCHTDK